MQDRNCQRPTIITNNTTYNEKLTIDADGTGGFESRKQKRTKSGNDAHSRQSLDYGSTMARVWKYAAMLLMLLTLGVGQMWGL